MFARGLAALTVAAIFIAGCGTPGPPLPPSLDLPRPVADLAVTRMGDQVEANFTLPDENTDHLAFKKLGAVVLQQCAQRSLDCVALQSWKPGEFKPGARVTWKGALPQRPYVTVVANNGRGRNAGAGNVVWLPLGPAAPVPTSVDAKLTRDAVVVSVQQPTNASDASLRLYRYNQDRREPVEIIEKPAVTGQLTDQNFEWDQRYRYDVYTVNRATSPEGETIEFASGPPKTINVETKDSFPPLAPTGLAAVFNGLDAAKLSIDLSWNPSTERDIAGYNIYRDGTKLNSELEKTTAFRDMQVEPGHSYAYQVSAVDSHGNESSRSEAATERVPQQP